jgi:hypothetical protein
MSRFSIWGIRDNIEQVQGLFSAGVALATGEITLGDLIYVMGTNAWDGLSGNLRFLIQNYHLFDPCLELSRDEVRDLARRTAGAYEELIQIGSTLYGFVQTAKNLVASRTARNLAQGARNNGFRELSQSEASSIRGGARSGQGAGSSVHQARSRSEAEGWHRSMHKCQGLLEVVNKLALMS